MSKLSPELKALIADPAARGGDVPAPSREVTQALFARLGAQPHVARDTWLCLAAAVLVTVNSPETLCRLYDHAAGERLEDQVLVASVSPSPRDGTDTRRSAKSGSSASPSGACRGCVSADGRGESAGPARTDDRDIHSRQTINNLGALHSHLPDEVRAGLQSAPERTALGRADGLALWEDIYGQHSRTLVDKLAAFHPDLAEYILAAHYGPLLTDPPAAEGQFRLGRILTSVIAIAALRALTGVGLQVTSHVYGLKKAKLDGKLEGEEWLTSDDGCMWIIRAADDIVNTVMRS